MKLILIIHFILSNISEMSFFQHKINIKIIEIFYFFLTPRLLTSGVCFSVSANH